MIIRTLGAGAGGGLPQWNCGCSLCRAARSGVIAPMTQSSAAISVDGAAWALLNASPDLRAQMAATPALHPLSLRGSPVQAVVLTNADVDHIAGLLTLREKTPFRLFATPGTLAVLDDNPVFRVLDPSLVTQHAIVLDQPFYPLPGLEVTAYAVPGKIALYLESGTPDTKVIGDQTIGLRLSSDRGVVHYLPGCADLPDWLCATLAEADVVMFDGTVWADDDMQRTGTGAKTGARMGHLAMSGAGGSLARLAGLKARRIFTHINNTNPVLMPDSAEQGAIVAAGWEIAHDGMEVAL